MRFTMISVCLACHWLVIFGNGSTLYAFARAAQEQIPPAANDDANAYTSDEAFSAAYDSVSDLRSSGDSVQAFEKLEPFIERLTRDRKNATKSEDGEARYVVALALRANLLRDLNRNAESIEAQESLLKMMDGLTSKASRLMRLELETNYAQSLDQNGERDKAFATLNSVLEGYKQLVADFPEDPVLKIQSTTAANNLGTTLVGKGGHREALQIFVDAIGLLRKINDPEHVENRDRKLALLLQNAAFAASIVGDPTQARTYIEESLALSEKLGPQDSKDAIRARMTLGAILARLNQYGESAETYGKLIDQLRRLYPEIRYPDGTVDLAIVLDNRAVSLVRLDKVEEAIPLATEASRMFEALAKESPRLKLNAARSGANVALLNARLGNSEAAASGLDRAITLYEEMFPDGHPELPGLYRSKAINLSQLRRDSDSIDAAERALELARDSFPSEVYPFGHGILAQALDSTGLIYFAAGQPEKAGKYFEQAVEMHGRLADETLKHISEAESLQFLAVADAFKSHLLSVPLDNKRAYALLASEKGRILAQQRNRFQAARESQDPATVELLAKYQLIRGQLARAVLTPTSNPQVAAAVRKLQADREEIERQIAQATESGKTENSGRAKKSLFSSITSNLGGDVNLDQRIHEIPKGTTVIEFFSYEHYSINDEASIRRTEGSQKLSAFVLVGGSPEVRRIDFGETLGLRQQTRRLVVAMQFGTEQEPLAEVSQFVCPKLCPVIPQDCTKLVIIPDGITSAIPFACLIDPSREKSLVESFEIIIQSSLHRPARNGQALLSDQSSVVAVGGIDYGPIAKGQPVQFYPLPGTVKELGNLQKWFGTEGMQRLEGSQVTPELLLQTIPSADIVHLATHAYVTDFAKNAVTNNKLNTGAVRVTADQRSPLLAARMALSLANDFEKDAILTGEQFAATDLSKTKLVVLSACESGVGEKVLGEGVFGLQRAFHIAGVPSVLATLWPVSDADAVVFMDYFYTELIEKQQTPAAALRAAQLAMIKADERANGAVRSVEDGKPAENELAASSLRRGIRFDFAPDDATPLPAVGTDQTDVPTRSQTKSSTARSTWAAFFLSTD